MPHYTLTNFIRQASNDFLAEYFEGRGIDLGIDIKSLKARNNEPVVAAINTLPDEERAGLDQDFIGITALADKAGLQHIIQEARYQNLGIEADLQNQHGMTNKSLWVFLKHPAVHDSASRFAVPYTQGRYWKRRLPVTSAPGIEPGTKAAALETAVRRYFLKEEGRGKACKIEYLERRPIHFFFAYPEDFSAAPLAWSGTSLAPHPLRPAFEVIFVYHEIEGTLDVYFEGQKKTVERLWQVFAETVLEIKELPKVEKPIFAIDRLKAEDLAFIRASDSEIIDVRIKGLKFAILGHPATTVALETSVTRDAKAIHEMVKRTFATKAPEPGRFSLSQTKVISARIQATIDQRDGKKPKTRTFNMTEGTCNLKYDRIDRLLRQMMAESGIDHSRATKDASSESTRRIPEHAAG